MPSGDVTVPHDPDQRHLAGGPSAAAEVTHRAAISRPSPPVGLRGAGRAPWRRAPFATFTVLALMITWAVWVPRALTDRGVLGGGEVWGVLGSVWTYGPAVAAIVAAAVVGGRAHLVELGRRLRRVDVGARWYAMAVVGPAVAGLLVTGGAVALGDTWTSARPWGLQAGISDAAVLLVLLILTDGIGEEVGWRGYAQPRLEERMSGTAASLLLGVVWALWHLPLFWTDGAPLQGTSIWLLLLRLPATAVVFTWMYRRTRGSTVMAVVLHAALNLFGAPAALRPLLIQLALHWVVAVVIITTGGVDRRRA